MAVMGVWWLAFPSPSLGVLRVSRVQYIRDTSGHVILGFGARCMRSQRRENAERKMGFI